MQAKEWFGRFKESFRKNPFAWIFFVLLVGSIYHQYRTGIDLSKVCDDVEDMIRAPPFPSREIMAPWQKKAAAEIEAICGPRQAKAEAE